jgi:hypothetical protein
VKLNSHTSKESNLKLVTLSQKKVQGAKQKGSEAPPKKMKLLYEFFI